MMSDEIPNDVEKSNCISADGDKALSSTSSSNSSSTDSSSSSTTSSSRPTASPINTYSVSIKNQPPIQTNISEESHSLKASTDENHNDRLLSGSQVLESLEEEISAEEQAIAVLGAADDSKCTYSKGYVNRQALYSCLTCKENTRHPVLCYACSIHCHDGHSLIELFTKRSIRCDCPTHSCKIEALVVDPNYQNRYNQNSQLGKYCICKTTFPDETDPVADSMYQCVVCEDWFHSRHLFTEDEVSLIPENNAIEEHITHQVEFKDKNLEDRLDAATTEVVCVACRKRQPYLADVQHLCTSMPVERPSAITKGLIFDNSRRIQWQQCEDCEDVLHKNGIAFLADLHDSIYHFEKVQTKAVDNQVEAYINDHLDHAGKLKLMSGIADMKTGFKEFLETRKRNGETIITEESVRDFFEQLRKKPKLQ